MVFPSLSPFFTDWKVSLIMNHHGACKLISWRWWNNNIEVACTLRDFCREESLHQLNLYVREKETCILFKQLLCWDFAIILFSYSCLLIIFLLTNNLANLLNTKQQRTINQKTLTWKTAIQMQKPQRFSTKVKNNGPLGNLVSVIFIIISYFLKNYFKCFKSHNNVLCFIKLFHYIIIF